VHGEAVPQWQPGSELTLGAEDELLLVDERGQLLGAAAEPLMATLLQHAPAAGAVKGEIFVDEVEVETPVCADADQLHRSLAGLRRWLTADGARPMAVGVHPAGEVGTAVLSTSTRYDRIAAEFGGLLRTPTAAFQVHVGLPDPATALRAYRVLRNRLSVFRALAAGSPYWHGRDSGLACVRPAILRSYPRTTMPPVLRTWEEYVETVERSMWVHEVPDYTYVCWELRPQPRLGTLEVRVMDAQPSVAAAAGLAALVQGLAGHALEHPDADDLPDEVVLANDLRACRNGLDATVLDVEGARRSIREVATRALEEAQAALAPDGRDAPLEAVRAVIAGPAEHARQRRLCGQQGMPALLADLAARTAGAEG
jgi:carboxylate-amine ligase